MKLRSLVAALFISQTIAAFAEDSKPYAVASLPTLLDLSYDSLKRPSGKENLGLIGVNLNADIYKGIYAGVGGYGAAQGDLGGLFILGIDGGYRHQILKNTWFDVGSFIGGGGAHHDSDDTSGTNSGFMSREHLGFSQVFFNTFSLGIDYSYVNYPDYDIHSYQWGILFTLPGNFLTGSPTYQGAKVTDLNEVSSPANIGFYKSFVSAYQETYFTDTNEAMQLAGMKYGAYFQPHTYVGLSTAGSYDSTQNGYMDLYLLLGHDFHITDPLFIYTELQSGMGGGGNTNTGGGLIYKPMIGVGYDITTNFGLRLGGGYMKATGGDFEGPVAELGAYYNFLNSTSCYICHEDAGSNHYYFSGWRVGIMNERYDHPQRSNGVSDNKNIDLVTINLDKMLNDYAYFSGQATSAYGGNAGSYATGLLGPGIQTSEYHRVRLLADLMVGAAGGGAIDVGRGAIYQPEIGLSVTLSEKISWVTKLGRMRSFDGSLDTNTLSTGIQFNITTLQEER